MITLTNQLKLHPNMEGWTRSFGQSIDCQGDILAIGSDDTPVEQYGNCGTVHIYKKWIDRWIEKQVLYNPDPTQDSFYGWSVSVDPLGRRIVVGADDHDMFGPCAGMVYIYKRVSNDKFELEQKLWPIEKFRDHAYFGFSVDIYGDELIVGAPSYQSKAEELIKGKALPSVYFYIRKNGKYKLLDKASTACPFFGGNVRIFKHGYISTSHRNRSGEIWIYDKNRKPIQFIDPPPGAYTFGKSIEVYEDWMIVGAPLSHDPGGKAYIYGWISGKYRLLESLTPFATSFGYDVSVNDKYFVVSDPRCLGRHMNYDNYCGGVGGTKGRIYLYDIENFNLVGIKTSKSPVGGHVVHAGTKNLFEGNPSANHSQGEVNIYDYSEFRTSTNV